MISAPQEHNKNKKASHSIIRCNWLFLLCEYYFLDKDVYYIEVASVMNCSKQKMTFISVM